MFIKLSDAIIDLAHIRHVTTYENTTTFLDEDFNVMIELERVISAEEIDMVSTAMEKSRPHIAGTTLIAPAIFRSILGVVEIRLSHHRSVLIYENGDEVDVGGKLSTNIISQIYEINLKKKNNDINTARR
jgi:hypothetical protein